MRSTLAREAVAVSRASDTVVHRASSPRKRPTRPIFSNRPVETTTRETNVWENANLDSRAPRLRRHRAAA